MLRFKRSDIRDGYLWITQGKTAQKLRIKVEGRLAEVIEPALNRPRKVVGLHLVQDENGQRVTGFALRSRFDRARMATGVNFQFRDIRAKGRSRFRGFAACPKAAWP